MLLLIRKTFTHKEVDLLSSSYALSALPFTDSVRFYLSCEDGISPQALFQEEALFKREEYIFT